MSDPWSDIGYSDPYKFHAARDIGGELHKPTPPDKDTLLRLANTDLCAAANAIKTAVETLKRLGVTCQTQHGEDLKDVCMELCTKTTISSRQTNAIHRATDSTIVLLDKIVCLEVEARVYGPDDVEYRSIIRDPDHPELGNIFESGWYDNEKSGCLDLITQARQAAWLNFKAYLPKPAKLDLSPREKWLAEHLHI